MDIIKPLFFAFLPIAVATYAIAYYSFRNGEVTIDEDDGEIDLDLDVDWGDKKEKDKTKKKKKPKPNNLLHKKWVDFGGGFYGLMAFITFSYIEVLEVFNFVQALESWRQILDYLNFNTLVDVFIQSIKNMIAAFVWFTYWPKQIIMSNGWIWLGLAYGGYHVGRTVASWQLKLVRP